MCVSDISLFHKGTHDSPCIDRQGPDRFLLLDHLSLDPYRGKCFVNLNSLFTIYFELFNNIQSALSQILHGIELSQSRSVPKTKTTPLSARICLSLFGLVVFQDEANKLKCYLIRIKQYVDIKMFYTVLF